MDIVNKIVTQLENGLYEQALEEVQKILKSGSNEEKFLVAEQIYKFGFISETKELIKQLLMDYPNEGELIILLAEILMEEGDEEAAILELEKISVADPSYPEALLLLADLFQMEGLYEVSEQKILKAKELLPNEVVIDFALGELYSEEGKFIEAIRCYEKVLEKEETVAGVNVNQRIADAMSAGGAFEEALRYYEKAIKERVELNTLFNYGFTALQAGFNQKAIEQFLQLKELDPEYFSLYMNLARAYEREEDLVKAYGVIKDGIKYDEFNKDLYFYGGKLALKTGNEDEAETMLREALALDPELIEAARTLNSLFILQERYGDVLEIISFVGVEEDPQFLWDEALAYQNLEEYSQALNSYERAYTFFKDTSDFLAHYGYFLMEEGNREKAVEVFSKLIKLEPDNEEFFSVWQRLSEDISSY
ncbi:tetratricopeptide repeat protein [Niallia sp. Krafla_26]|uniref:tetratricopeptide repeat protein n=1 Tax=Niallia sp. Krafla_26 TaxID=3064703 RepID=UPI003D170F77